MMEHQMIEQRNVLLEVTAITEDDTCPYAQLQPVSKLLCIYS